MFPALFISQTAKVSTLFSFCNMFSKLNAYFFVLPFTLQYTRNNRGHHMWMMLRTWNRFTLRSVFPWSQLVIPLWVSVPSPLLHYRRWGSGAANPSAPPLNCFCPGYCLMSRLPLIMLPLACPRIGLLFVFWHGHRAWAALSGMDKDCLNVGNCDVKFVDEGKTGVPLKSTPVLLIRMFLWAEQPSHSWFF